MTVAFIVGEHKPTSCGACPLWVKTPLGYPSYCNVGGKYTEEEIISVKDGRLKMYYTGYLRDNIPKNCPLIEIPRFAFYPQKEQYEKYEIMGIDLADIGGEE